MRQTICILLFLKIAFASLAWDYNTFNFNEIYDLKENTIYDLLQDSAGYFWFGTNTGLYRFDGNQFKQYLYKGYDIEYTNLKIDSVGNLWCSNFGGQLFSVLNDTLRLIVKNEKDPSFISNYFFRHDSTLILHNNSFSQLNLYDLKTQEQINLFGAQNAISTTDSKNKKLFFIEAFNLYPNQDLINVSLFELDKNSLRINYLKNTILDGGSSWSLVEIDNQLLLSSYDELHRIYNFNKDEVIFQKPLSKSRVNSFHSFDNKAVIATKSNYAIVDPLTGDSKIHLEGLDVSTVYRDAQNNIWVGTLGEGIHIISNSKITSFKAENQRIIDFFIDDSNRLHTINAKGTFRTYLPPYNQSLPGKSTLEPYGIFVNSYTGKVHNIRISNIAEYSFNNMVFSKDFTGKPFKNAVALSPNISLVNCYAYAALIRTGQPSPLFGMDTTDFKKFRSSRTENVFKGPSTNEFYVSYSNGLYYYDSDCNAFPVQLENDQMLLALSGFADATGLFWVGSKNQQLHALRKDEIVFSVELPENIISIIRNGSFIFAASKNNLYRIVPESGEVDVIGEDNGLLSEDILGVHAINDSIIIISNRHFQKIPANMTSRIEQAPVVTNVQLQLFGKNIKSTNGSHQLKPNENNIAIEFTGYSLTTKNRFTFQYRMKNLDSKWVATPSVNNIAQFPELPSGTYQFELRACNNDGICSKPHLLEFSIDRPFYNKAWFVGIALIALGGIGFRTVRVYLKNATRLERQKSAQQLMEKQVFQAKLAALRSQMNPHFMFNALNTIQEFIVSNQQDIASDYLADFADLMRKYLDQSQKETLSLDEELETLKLYLRLEDLRLHGKLIYNLNIKNLAEIAFFELPVMLIQPFVENAIKHGLLHKKGEKRLEIAIQEESEGLFISIEDNGVGRAQSQEFNRQNNKMHQSFATSATEQRIALLNKSYIKHISYQIVDLESEGKASGTRVEIRIN